MASVWPCHIWSPCNVYSGSLAVHQFHHHYQQPHHHWNKSICHCCFGCFWWPSMMKMLLQLLLLCPTVRSLSLPIWLGVAKVNSALQLTRKWTNWRARQVVAESRHQISSTWCSRIYGQPFLECSRWLDNNESGSLSYFSRLQDSSSFTAMARAAFLCCIVDACRRVLPISTNCGWLENKFGVFASCPIARCEQSL